MARANFKSTDMLCSVGSLAIVAKSSVQALAKA
jgi:hypothetical protein